MKRGLVLGMLLCTSKAWAVAPVQGKVVAEITMVPPSVDETSQRRWAEACASLAKRLIAGGGIAGTGIFDRVHCPKGPTKSPPDVWSIVLSRAKSGWKLTARTPSSWTAWREEPLTELVLPKGSDPLAWLSDIDYSGLVAYGLLDSFPALGRARAGADGSWHTPKPKLPRRWRWAPNGIDQAVAYTLTPSADGRFLEAMTVASGDGQSGSEGDDCTTRPRFHLASTPGHSSPGNAVVFVHSAGGRGTRRAEIVALLADATATLRGGKHDWDGACFDEKVLLKTSAWQIGAQLGTSTVTAPTLLQDARFAALSIERRFAKSLGVGLETRIVPRTEEPGTGQALALSSTGLFFPFHWNLHALTAGIVQEVTPSLTFQQFSVDSTLVDESGAETELTTGNRAASTGRLRIERRVRPVPAEVFVERVVTVPVATAATGPQTVASTTYGGSVELLRLPPKDAVGLRLFFRVEQLSFEGIPDDEGNERDVELELAFAGIGMTAGF